MKTHDITLLFFFNKWAYEKGFALGVMLFFFNIDVYASLFRLSFETWRLSFILRDAVVAVLNIHG